MKVKWQKLFTNFIVWVVAETTLNLVQLDEIADYSEFLFPKEEIETTLSTVLY